MLMSVEKAHWEIVGRTELLCLQPLDRKEGIAAVHFTVPANANSSRGLLDGFGWTFAYPKRPAIERRKSREESWQPALLASPPWDVVLRPVCQALTLALVSPKSLQCRLQVVLLFKAINRLVVSNPTILLRLSHLCLLLVELSSLPIAGIFKSILEALCLTVRRPSTERLMGWKAELPRSHLLGHLFHFH